MEELGIEQPTSWDEFVAAMQAAQDAGYTALAHGGQAWQDATIFDSMVMGVGGPDFYQASMVDLDPEALGSDMMVEAFQRMETLRGFVDDNFSGRDWNLASAMVINGEALFQIMGDWAKGEFVNAGQTAGDEFTCFRVPGTEGTVTFNSDQFAMFNVTDARAEAQLAMASAVMSPEFQITFNLVKGSVPGAHRRRRPISSTCADRWAWRNWPKRRQAAACSAPWPMATPTRRRAERDV
jgi:glucose/mannose transport system substrate-binding protein